MVHMEGKGVHGRLAATEAHGRAPLAAAAEQFLQASQKGRDQESSRGGPGGSNTGFIRPFPGRRITLLWLRTFGFMDYERKEVRRSRCKVTGVCPAS